MERVQGGGGVQGDIEEDASQSVAIQKKPPRRLSDERKQITQISLLTQDVSSRPRLCFRTSEPLIIKTACKENVGSLPGNGVLCLLI